VDDATDPTAPAPPVVAADPSLESMADAVADRLGSARLSLEAWRSGAGGPIVVWCDAAGLALRGPAGTRAKPVRPALPARPRSGLDPLLRAVGPWPSVVDATAGWGVDAATLAAAGREVVLLERHPVLAALLRDVIDRGRAAGHPAALRMRVVEADARCWLATAVTDVVLLDPMYPEPGAHGARKAEGLHLARRLVGDDLDQDQLLVVARRAARRRVVVKRPVRAPALAGRPPSGTLRGRTVRYDLYAPEEAPP
jgi:16S rRNA (guanine1516-N2)-methyltransferase